MGALFGECILNRESHYIRWWRFANTSDTIAIPPHTTNQLSITPAIIEPIDSA